MALIGGHDNLLILQNTFFFFVLDPSFLIYTCDEYLKESFAALVEAMDAFVALTEVDEENMVISMFANNMKVKKTITQIRSDNLGGMLHELGIKNNVSPKDIVANRIISYVRALANKRGSNVLTLYRVVEGRVEALEFFAKKPEKFYDKPLKDLHIKANCLIACIIRKNEVIIPNGNSCIKQGDNVIVVTTHKNFDDLTDILE